MLHSAAVLDTPDERLLMGAAAALAGTYDTSLECGPQRSSTLAHAHFQRRGAVRAEQCSPHAGSDADDCVRAVLVCTVM